MAGPAREEGLAGHPRVIDLNEPAAQLSPHDVWRGLAELRSGLRFLRLKHREDLERVHQELMHGAVVVRVALNHRGAPAWLELRCMGGPRMRVTGCSAAVLWNDDKEAATYDGDLLGFVQLARTAPLSPFMTAVVDALERAIV